MKISVLPLLALIFGSAIGVMLLIIAFIIHGDHHRSGWMRRERMPYSLRKAKLFMNETEIIDKDGKRMRVDQVFQLPSGRLVVVDTKTRSQHRLRYSDIAQIARYRRALQRTYNHKLAPFSYVRSVTNADVEHARQVKYIRVPFR